MDRGIYVAASGAISHSKTLDIISNNLAAGNIIGFKKESPVFNMQEILANHTASAADSKPLERVFVNIKGVFEDFSQGILKSTGSPLDAAISGDGFFVVQTPEGERYTRMGSFTMDKDGKLKTKSGFDVEGENGVITLTQGRVSIAQDGSISVDGAPIDKLKVVVFPKPYPLQKVGEGLFKAAGPGMNPKPAEGVSVFQGNLEMSNVNTVQEMVSMLNALRAYESQMKAVKGFDDITDSAIKLAS
ncbi:MAG: flagellar basal-body rod protein FlgF [Deltaproteobacteria bacterium]|nr:flagellar basal-body rod protein FlgF [Deltaproteobacteria bacterium]